jgi:hypothetical protein
MAYVVWMKSVQKTGQVTGADTLENVPDGFFSGVGPGGALVVFRHGNLQQWRFELVSGRRRSG